MINLRVFTLIILTATILGVLTPAARATLIIFNNRTAFNSAEPGLPVETFENNLRPNNTVTSFQEPLNNTSNNIAFAPGRILPGINLSVSPGTMLVLVTQGSLGAPSDVVGPFLFVEDLVLDFAPTVNAVGFDLFALSSPGPVSVNVVGAGNLLGSLPLVLSPTATFFGVVSTSDRISQITITETTPAAVGELIDNVAFGAVPEPTTIALAASGLLTLFGLTVRSRIRLRAGWSRQSRKTTSVFRVRAAGGQTGTVD
jgi:hypothetical protein